MHTEKRLSLIPLERQTRNTKRRFRVCTFTLNNFSTDEYQHILDARRSLTKLVFQSEVGENGTHHLQGMAQSPVQKTFDGWKELFKTKRVHLEQCKNVNASRNYCKKDDSWNGRIRFEMWDGVIISDINVDNPDGQLVIYNPPKEIIDYKNKMIYTEGGNYNRELAKKRFVEYISNGCQRYMFEQHILFLDETILTS